MRPIPLALALMLATPVDAAACHHFRYWRYKTSQHCTIRPARRTPAAPVAVAWRARAAPARRPEPARDILGAPAPVLDDQGLRARALESIREALKLKAIGQ
jgi:hypothetical protein